MKQNKNRLLLRFLLLFHLLPYRIKHPPMKQNKNSLLLRRFHLIFLPYRIKRPMSMKTGKKHTTNPRNYHHLFRQYHLTVMIIQDKYARLLMNNVNYMI
jgi:hypothetical protein